MCTHGGAAYVCVCVTLSKLRSLETAVAAAERDRSDGARERASLTEALAGARES